MKPIVFTPRPPADRKIADRLRRAARLTWIFLRAVALAPGFLARRRLRRPPRPAEVRRILVIRTDRLGDMALTTPALQDLRDHFRKASLTVLAPAGPIALLEAHPAVDQRLELPVRGVPPAIVGAFDLAIDFTPDARLRGARLAAASQAAARAGFRGGGREVHFNLPGPRARRDRHLVDLNRELVAALGVEPRAARPALYLADHEREAALARLAALGAAAPRVALHPGGFHPTQRWSPERYAEVIRALTERTAAACVVLEGPGDAPLAARICAATPDALRPGPLPIRALMGLIAACDLFIGSNSGPLHIAGALGIPTVSIVGPTDLVRFAPHGPDDRVVRLDLPCSPCGRGRCWHHSCLRGIETSAVLAMAEAAFADAVSRGLDDRREAR
jgi:ADP-heptose:LPS heptosyltransferase